MIDTASEGRQEQEYYLVLQGAIQSHFESAEVVDGFKLRINIVLPGQELSLTYNMQTNSFEGDGAPQQVEQAEEGTKQILAEVQEEVLKIVDRVREVVKVPAGLARCLS